MPNSITVNAVLPTYTIVNLVLYSIELMLEAFYFI